LVTNRRRLILYQQERRIGRGNYSSFLNSGSSFKSFHAELVSAPHALSSHAIGNPEPGN
jgi:hypothetical protein